MNRQKIIDILKNKDSEPLFVTADKIRKKNVGDEVHLRALIEFSNICKCQCKYCGLRSGNDRIERYRLTPEQIIEQSNLAVRLGYKTIVLQSGEDIFYDSDKICEIIREIKKSDVAITLSIGEKSFEEYKAYKEAGADRYLLRIETTDESLYKELHPKASFENRVRCLEDLKTLGYELGTGCMVGLPNQTIEALADDILFFKEIKADMVGIGPFIPHKDTPLREAKNGDFELALRVMALTRVCLPEINIPATTAMETLRKDGRLKALKSGANVVMPNLTPEEFRSKYEIYPNKSATQRSEVETMIKSIGRCVATDCGTSKSFKK